MQLSHVHLYPVTLYIKIRYYVEPAERIQEVCESLKINIQRWIDSKRLEEVCRVTGLTSILKGQIDYELPMKSDILSVKF